MSIKIGDKIKVKAFELDFNGQGVAKYNDIVVFVMGLLPKETALVEVIKINKNFVNARVLEIIKTSEHRKNMQSNLGSLDLYHLSNEEQLKWQVTTTINTFKKICNINLNYNNNIIHNNNYYQYRNKNVFHVLDEDILTLGLYNLDSNLIKVNKFLLAPKVVNDLVTAINELQFPITSLKGILKHVVFRTNVYNEVMVTLVLTEAVEVNDLVKELIKFNTIKSIYLNISPSQRHILGKESYLLYGVQYLEEDVLNLKLPFDDKSFLQVNTNVSELVYQTISKYIEKGQVIIDAYSGVGAIGLSVAKKALKVYLLEANESSVEISKQLISKNKFNNVQVIAGDVLNTINELEADILIVDPPRSGLNKAFVRKILEKEFKTIIYLACDIKTQARDYNLLKEKYRIAEFYPIKMFYQTTAIENLIILKKGA